MPIMKQTTEAIVLGLRKHSDKLSVLHVYSKAEGRLALQVYGAHGKHKVRAAYQPLSVVEITYDAQPSRTMPVLSTVDPLYMPEQVYGDIRRQTIALFVTEMLMLTLTHPMHDSRMYEFIDDFVHELNGNQTPENMHLLFMLRLAELLGIGMPDGLPTDTVLSQPMSRTQRQQELRRLCDYYLEHVDSFRPPKSLDILIEVFD
jgi:Recombinational DNA repair protein (RecF pathway)